MADTEIFIFELSKSSFNTSAVLNSYKLPVFVEFMTVWSEPCIQMSDTLSKLATEFAGQFIFAKVDVDEQPELAQEYAIENVPSLKVLKDGEVHRTVEGLLQEAELRDMLKALGIYNASDELRQQAREAHLNGDTLKAIQLLTEAIHKDPRNTRVAMDMVQIFLDIGDLEQAKGLFNKLPDRDKESEVGKTLIGQITFQDLAANTEGRAALEARIAMDANDLDAHFDLSLCLVAEYDYALAVDHLFFVYDRDEGYKQGAVKEMIITLANMLSANEPELAQNIRRRLGNIVH